MPERIVRPLAWVWIAMVLAAGGMLVTGASDAGATDDHEKARSLRDGGEILSLVEILQSPALHGLSVIEAELERKDGRLVYELELLDPSSGRVTERYFDAATGKPLAKDKGGKH